MQYRGKKNFYFMNTIPFQMEFTAVNWSFLEAGPGKGPADSVGATIKRTAESQVARGTDIPTAKALYDALLPLTKVKLFFVEEEQISTLSAHLPEKCQGFGLCFMYIVLATLCSVSQMVLDFSGSLGDRCVLFC
ncbi:hypothetical protein ILYODFUR_031994 [Ilyodon furcidens]|uniref:Uncharacterized protein n=1 Tax=Ilyodon furcidens TaxID=33524 RepID=A0ABV0U2B6_9TELE